MSYTFSKTEAYRKWLLTIKTDIQQRQIKAAVRVNTELLLLYWDLGKDIIEKQEITSWGEGLIPQLASDLANAFPGAKGFSRSNLFYIRKWVQFYSQPLENIPQLVGQFQIAENQPNLTEQEIVPRAVIHLPWGHNRVIIDKCKTIEEALFYVQHTLAHWSRSVLIHQIESKLHLRKANALHNFEHTLDKIQAELAHETLKNPYNFDFLTMGTEVKEREIESALLNQLKKFLLELGQGFAFLGQQYPLQVGGDSFYLDLLFYHARLHCYIVVEIKTTNFQPEFVGKLNFYLAVVDDILKQAEDKPSIGILLCKSSNKVVVEYCIKSTTKPVGISDYTLLNAVPDNFKGQLPTVEDLEQELIHNDDDGTKCD